MCSEKESSFSVADFISEIITQVTEGLHRGQENTRRYGTRVFPDSFPEHPTKIKISFDLTVTETMAGGKKSLMVGMPLLNLKGETGTTGAEAANRVHFTVPVAFRVFNPENARPPESPPPKTISMDDLLQWGEQEP